MARARGAPIEGIGGVVVGLGEDEAGADAALARELGEATEERRGDPAALLKPCPAEWLKLWKVSARVGSVKNNDAGLLDAID